MSVYFRRDFRVETPYAIEVDITATHVMPPPIARVGIAGRLSPMIKMSEMTK